MLFLGVAQGAGPKSTLSDPLLRMDSISLGSVLGTKGEGARQKVGFGGRGGEAPR